MANAERSGNYANAVQARKDADQDFYREHKSLLKFATDPPLPQEDIPPLPTEENSTDDDDGWAPVWDVATQAYYFYNRLNQKTQWENPRIADIAAAPFEFSRISSRKRSASVDRRQEAVTEIGGYNPSIHGDYDPNADYAQEADGCEDATMADRTAVYSATGTFNRFTGRWQDASLTPENFNDDNRSRRQLNAYFDVDAAASTHDGRSLKAERAGKKLSKKDIKAFREKRKEKKEVKRRAWLKE